MAKLTKGRTKQPESTATSKAAPATATEPSSPIPNEVSGREVVPPAQFTQEEDEEDTANDKWEGSTTEFDPATKATWPSDNVPGAAYATPHPAAVAAALAASQKEGKKKVGWDLRDDPPAAASWGGGGEGGGGGWVPNSQQHQWEDEDEYSDEDGEGEGEGEGEGTWNQPGSTWKTWATPAATQTAQAIRETYGPAAHNQNHGNYNGAWSNPPPAAMGWTTWGKEAAALPKVTTAPPTRTQPVSTEQRSQYLHSLLDMPTQTGRPAAPPRPEQIQRSQTSEAYFIAAEESRKQQERIHRQFSGGRPTHQRAQSVQYEKAGRHERRHRSQTGPWGIESTASTGSEWETSAETGGWNGRNGGNDWNGGGGGGGWVDTPQDNKSAHNLWDPPVNDDWDGETKTNKKAHGRHSSQPAQRYDMPSKTMAHAYNGSTRSLPPFFDGAKPNAMNNYADINFVESKGAALQPLERALYGKNRLAKDRIHWMFPADKDDRVASLLRWIQELAYNLGGFGLHKFLQSRERGALVVNAAYRPPNTTEPAFDWLTFDQLQPTMDRILQESVAYYNPAVQVVIFVVLPSPTGNSVAAWRRKINVPNNMRSGFQTEIALAVSALRRDDNYIVHVDEVPAKRKQSSKSEPSRKKEKEEARPPTPPIKKKKKKWWKRLF